MLIDNATGDYATDTIYDDANPDQIESLPDTQIHRNVDLELIKADKEGAIAAFFSVPIYSYIFIRLCQGLHHLTLYDLWDCYWCFG